MRKRAQQVEVQSRALHPRPPPKDAKVYRRENPPPPLASSSTLPSAALSHIGDPRGHYSVSSDALIPILLEIAEDSPATSFHSDSSRDLLPLSVLMAQYEEQFPSLEASCSKNCCKKI